MADKSSDGRPRSWLIPILSAGILAGWARMVVQKIRRDRRQGRPPG